MSAPRFLCDEMLGKLARELRTLGYDATYAHGSDDEAILARAEREDRRLLTRDRGLADRAGSQATLLASRDPGEQLASVIERERLAPTAAGFLSRCLECNEPLVAAEDAEEVPADHADGPQWRCPVCDRVYWPGTHAHDMLERLGEHLPGEPDPSQALGPPDGTEGERKP
ncbi:hypothetical protein BRD56_12825 [Thermoplasmatales archaeon SW_10_69_26]|nr:MAG: hypothetical protein BRD56_12825 [Thermoplasmatales archaeon SW_10_69_26]